FRDLEGIKPILKKIAIVSLALYFVIPLSVHISDRIYETYQASIDNTISAAEDLAEDAAIAGSSAEDQNAIQRIWSALSESASSFAERGAEILNRFIESLAVMIVTSCVIPILVLLFSLWIINQVFGFSIPAPSRRPRLRPHLPGPHRTLGSGSAATEAPEDEVQE
ncbi:MAG: hypothetical protein IKO00_06240, partial [Oscillospiraceae bacterium]|nr:hypothetical protein [Oscillospiraceae bacterium]